MPMVHVPVPIIWWLSPNSYQFIPDQLPQGSASNKPEVAFIEFSAPSGGPSAPLTDVSLVLLQQGKFVGIPSSALQLGQAIPANLNGPGWTPPALSWGPNNQPLFNLTFGLTDSGGNYICSGSLYSIPNETPPGYFSLQALGQPPPPGGFGEPQWFAGGTWSPTTVRGVIVEWVDIGDPLGLTPAGRKT